MAQHYFSFERDHGGDFPRAVRQAESETYTESRAGIVNIGAGPALIITKTTANLWNRVRLPVISADIEVLTRVRRCAQESTVFNNTGAGVFFRAPEAIAAGYAGYYVSIASVNIDTNSGRFLSLYQRAGDNQVLIAQNTTALPLISSVFDRMAKPVFIRARAIGAVIQARAWYDGDDEPAGWHINVTRPAGEESGGSCGMQVCGYASVTEWSFFSVGTNGDPAPSEPVPLPQTSGKVNVDIASGPPGRFTSIVDATTGEIYAVSGPDADGHWTASVPPGDYYLLYTEPDCQPLVHGPYHVEAP